MRRKPTHMDEGADVNVTPLLDIVFIMLIFFIVTATFVREVGIDVTRPSDDNEEQQTKAGKVILIDITEEGSIFVNKRAIDIRAVRANVEHYLAESPNSGVVIYTAPAAKTGVAVRVLDQARRAGAGNVSISVQDQQES